MRSLNSKLAGGLIAAILFLPLQVHAQGSASPAAPMAPAGPQPQIQTLAPNYDFGTVLEGTPVKHEFTIKNSGKADLVIGHVQTSCGCTVAESDKKRLAPGEQTQLPVTFDTRHEKGHASRRIDVYTNDPKTPDLALEIQGVVRTESDAAPAEVFFGSVRKGTEQAREVAIKYNGSAKDFKITKVSNSNTNIAVTQEPGAKLKVALLKTMPPGPFQDTVEITTTGRPLEVPVYGRVVGDLVTDPAQVSFGILPHGAGATRIVRLTNNGARPVAIKQVSSTSPSVVAKAEPIAAGKQYKITLELRKGTADGQLRGQLVITTDDPEQADLTVPFYGIVGAFKG
jgi:Protein of unknown function (DUF1573)